jgi:hypothetical protein
MATVLCMKWGHRYGPDYVNTLASMVRRHLAIRHRLVCLTDDRTGIGDEVECRPLPTLTLAPEWERSPWRKLSCFAPDLADLDGPVLFLDLDVVIVDRIDPLFEHPGDFCIIENWTQRGRGIGNSSVYRYHAGAHQEVFERFRADPASAVREHPNSQTFLSRNLPALTFWPAAWCRSFKHECLPARPWRRIRPARLPAGARIVVFHGQPKPPDAARGIWPERGKGLRPVPWIAEHWR